MCQICPSAGIDRRKRLCKGRPFVFRGSVRCEFAPEFRVFHPFHAQYPAAPLNHPSHPYISSISSSHSSFALFSISHSFDHLSLDYDICLTQITVTSTHPHTSFDTARPPTNDQRSTTNKHPTPLRNLTKRKCSPVNSSLLSLSRRSRLPLRHARRRPRLPPLPPRPRRTPALMRLTPPHPCSPSLRPRLL